MYLTARVPQNGAQVCSIRIPPVSFHADLSPKLGNQPLVLQRIGQSHDR
jgi:hypothetical protein